MVVKILGYREVDYVNKEQRSIKGREFYVSCPKDGVSGDVCFSMFFSSGKYDLNLKVGSSADVSFELGRDLKPYPKSLSLVK